MFGVGWDKKGIWLLVHLVSGWIIEEMFMKVRHVGKEMNWKW